MLGIKNYNPKFYTDKNEFMKKHSDTLKSLIDSNLREVWTVHETSDGEFWADCPVILVIGEKQLEFCSFKDNEIGVTWGEIDLKVKLDWYGNQELNLEWRKNAIENISSFIGSRIEEIEVIEMAQETFDSKDNLLQSNLLLNGLGFYMRESYFSIFNALDETRFSFLRENNLMYTKV
ncbi:hypothetical protein [Ureibacillus sinduriensis]|uniref:Uncharacterized protein n=1 Tax=Ureibacillus sinduriensis BLB-1 = JCM 15800 TaxID=1384057 RepID=A0A0A3I5T9_9BACL|nr:hypothetical protein [Ureibacillus sinduriensis]KGR80094.1 hypothetical protein CD33_00220 [Ureibacillus sinduriensis BLB-1 = JCM 15800]